MIFMYRYTPTSHNDACGADWLKSYKEIQIDSYVRQLLLEKIENV